MKLKFESNQYHQKKAVESIVNLFEGQGAAPSEYEISLNTTDTLIKNELALGNNLKLSEEDILENLKKVQISNDITPSTHLEGMNFSVEMETGTGKTYVYLRTIMEMYKKYGFSKFVIVVPSIAIKEGTQKNLEITESHFRELYNNEPYTYMTYDSKKPTMLKSFALSNRINIMVINIDSFRKLLKDKDDDRKANIIHRQNDKMGGRKPIEYLQACNPIVIIDEPQSVDNTPKSQEAIATLNAMCTLRYSATHKNPYNLCYKLGPVEAFDLNLVKRIEVASAQADINYNFPYIKVEKIDNRNGLKVQLSVFVKGKNGIKLTKVNMEQDNDLYEFSGELEVYSNNYIIEGISAEKGNEYVEFANGKSLTLGEAQGDMKDELMKVQIRKTIEEHLEKERRYRKFGLKVLSLFFIDKVSNYRSYDGKGNPILGKIALWFEEAFRETVQKERYKGIIEDDISTIHNGYFSADKKGKLKDTKGNTQADTDTYTLIMKDKERLLSFDEPLRFIFSHSALREGWDNPNVFQICTLNETKSTMKKRQEIGRGLRLAVNQKGDRVKLRDYNILTVVANESYDTFVKNLQNEYEEDYGIRFGKVSKNAFSKIVVKKTYDNTANSTEEILGVEESEVIWNDLKSNGYIDSKGKITDAFRPNELGFELQVSDDIVKELKVEKQEIVPHIIAVMQNHQLESRIKKKENRRTLKLNKEVYLSDEFVKYWEKITQQTTYRVEYDTQDLIDRCAKEIKEMDRVEKIKITYQKAGVTVAKAGLKTKLLKNQNAEYIEISNLPDILIFLQGETQLTRKTIANILVGSERLDDFRVNPQIFMDNCARIIKNQLNMVIIDGIKYEKLDESCYEMSLGNVFEREELTAYIDRMIDVKNSVYNAVIFDSDIERTFAKELNEREDIEFFFKLPSKFRIDTPVGPYNPDWGIVKQEDGETKKLYLIRETKGGKDKSNLRESEAQKIKCGKKHFQAIGIDDFAVVTSAEEI